MKPLSRRISSQIPSGLLLAFALLVPAIGIAKPVKQAGSGELTIGRLVVPSLPAEFTQVCGELLRPPLGSEVSTSEGNMKGKSCFLLRPVLRQIYNSVR